ncbi:hypothetical protein [Pseudokineococcus lusitanus]|uniref:Uncharacterized protein n=1 Tax=Pseudokineococcus lusitanus TaxID=763993 RepID=A0A3N1HQ72_9ACTN|nr:hypothetical protein [Pseudokineococcus lusitanus]ROP44668.1 hypothetical protein EDC03_0794 [Pseudokineococcus lusitanus]
MASRRRAATTSPLGVRGSADRGITTTARLLLVGLSAGAVVGLLAGLILNTPADWRGEYSSKLPFFGLYLGLPAGELTQVVTALLVHHGRRRLPDRLLVAAAPCLAAGTCTALVASGAETTALHTLVAVTTAGSPAALIALTTRAWCLRPTGS